MLPATEPPSGRQYDLVPTIQAYIRYLRDAAHGKTGSEREQELKQQKLEADLALKGTQNELHRLKLDIAAGKYIPVEEATLDKGSWMVYQGCDREYAEQVTAEHKVNVRSGKKNVLTWVQKNSHGDNHYLDCEVYAAAAADILDVQKLYLEDIAQAPVPPEPAPAPEEEWIKTHENWI